MTKAKEIMNLTEQMAFPFPTMLEIRARLALANVYQRCNLGNHHALRGWALTEAQLVAYRAAEREDADVPCPLLFSDEPTLVEAWKHGVQLAANKRFRRRHPCRLRRQSLCWPR